jgi:hypothetical protein
MSTATDLDFNGSLATEVLPKYVMLVIFRSVNDQVEVLTRNHVLHIVEFPPQCTNPLVDGPIKHGEGEPFYILDIEGYLRSLFKYDIFDRVQDKQFRNWRPDFTNDLLILEVEIEPSYQLKGNSGAQMEIFPDIDTIYQKTLQEELGLQAGPQASEN